MAATTDITQALRYTYFPGTRILRLANEESPTFRLLSRKKAPMGGRGQFLLPISTQNAGAWTGAAQNGTWPTALDPATTEASFSLQEFLGVYKVTMKLLQDARNDKFAFQQVIKFMDEGFKARFMKMLNADLISNGLGKLAILPAADDETTVTVEAVPSCEKGQVVDVMDDTDNNAKLEDSATVSAVDPTALTVTLSGAPAGTAAGDYIVIQDTVATAYSYHTNGLIGIIDDADPPAPVGDYGGIDRTTAGTEYWESYVLSNGGTNRSFTEDLGLQAADGMRERANAQAKVYLSNLKIGRRYHEILRAESYYALGSNPSVLSGGLGRPGGKPPEDGKSPYKFSDMAWHFDPYFEANTIVILDPEHFFIGYGENELPMPVSKLFDTGGLFTETTTSALDVRWYYQAELLSDNPGAGAKIEDVAEA